LEDGATSYLRRGLSYRSRSVLFSVYRRSLEVLEQQIPDVERLSPKIVLFPVSEQAS
jgi:hypothetical protein